MIARKLSPITRRAALLIIAAAATLSAEDALAQDAIQVTSPADIIINPFASAKPQPRIVSEESQTSHRAPATYQNPFSAMSKSPPVDKSVRRGPASRWRHPIIPNEESSPIKSAVLSSQSLAPAHTSWDPLLSVEGLRHGSTSSGKVSGQTSYTGLANSPDAIRLTPKPLTQPTWLIAETDEIISSEASSLQVDPAVFDAPLSARNVVGQTVALSEGPDSELPNHVTSAFSMESVDASLARANVPPTIVSDCVDTAEGWLEQAQNAAKGAESGEDLTAVIQLCDRGLHRGPEGQLSSSLRRLSAWAHNRRGEVKSDAGRADDALDDFQIAISLDANCSLAVHNRAVTLAQQNQFAAALRDFNRVIELNPGLAVAYRNRAELLAALGRMDEAIPDYSQAIESLPKDAQLYRGRAYAYQRLGDFPNAMSDLDHALQISPNNADAFTQRGNLAAEQGNYDQAITDFRHSIAIDSKWTDAYRSLAWLQATCPDSKFHNPQQAIAAAEQAAKLSPADDYLILDTLAAARASAGQCDQAVEIQEKALAGAPAELAPSLQQRLALYRNGRAYRSASAPTAVRAASHESPANP